jgi:hypothetical protein
MKTITINGKQYPCRVTMGALLRFKRETGKDASELGQTDVADLITLLWCCVASASKADGVEFSLELMDFADRLEPDTLTGFYTSMGEGAPAGDAEKKTE